MKAYFQRDREELEGVEWKIMYSERRGRGKEKGFDSEGKDGGGYI